MASDAPAPIGDASPDVPRTPAFAVTRGGSLSAEELAALTIALTPIAVADEDEASAPAPAWAVAARLEGVGFRPFTSVDDIRTYHRTLA